ncbi:hypothetical protein PQX77_011265 [Marasmius sp. AFHP31]|nr:hypothetical protein PQX77_011265 [Marasmius sp. AFHP31]
MEDPLSRRYRPIPHGILLEIFDCMIVPSKLLNYGSTVMPHVDVYERIIMQKEILLLVCKGWYNVAVEMFYRESVTQSLKFIESLETVEFARSFKTPKLESLTLSWAPRSVDARIVDLCSVSDWIPLIEANGSQLSCLCMFVFQECGNSIASILERVPKLEHLVVDARLFNDPAPGAHPTLEYIDIWGACSVTGENARREESEGITLEIDETKFPSLKNIRVFDKALLSTAAHVDLPFMIPQGRTEYRYLGFINIATTLDGKVAYRNDMLNL